MNVEHEGEDCVLFLQTLADGTAIATVTRLIIYLNHGNKKMKNILTTSHFVSIQCTV